jgi:hypothetical protein
MPAQIVAGTGATSPNKTEDAAAASGDVGTAVMGIQTASPADAASAGDYGFLQIKDGRLWVRQLDGLQASATFTPAASSHVANDVNGGAQTFAFAAPSGSVFCITDAELEIDGATAEATAWRLYLYNVTPPSATADDGAWDLPSGDRASFLGYIDLGTAVDLGSTQWVETHAINKVVKLSGTSVFGYLVNLTTLTPAAVAHTVKLYGTPI